MDTLWLFGMQEIIVKMNLNEGDALYILGLEMSFLWWAAFREANDLFNQVWFQNKPTEGSSQW